MNVFDEDEIEEEEIIEEDLPPPPPTFSEDELAAAKAAAHAQGHAAATKEAQESRSKFVADSLHKIAQDTMTLFAAEAAREKAYEREVLALCVGIFEKLFPIYAEKHGFDELSAQVEQVLQEHSGKGAIELRIAPDMVDAMQAFMSKLSEKHGDLHFTVSGDEGLAGDAVQLLWADGGAVRDTGTMAAQVLAKMQELLAGTGATSHDGEEINERAMPDDAGKNDAALTQEETKGDSHE
ncbi:MAG: hypothetical protein ACRBCT_08780 [Alphaproteobacteria bacterium]